MALHALIMPTLRGEERTPGCVPSYVWARLLPCDDLKGPTQAVSTLSTIRATVYICAVLPDSQGALDMWLLRLKNDTFISMYCHLNCHMCKNRDTDIENGLVDTAGGGGGGQTGRAAVTYAHCHAGSRLTLCDHGLQPARLLCPWGSPSRNTGVGCHFFLQGIFPIQGPNPGLLHCSQILYPLSHQGSPYTAAAAAAKSLQSCLTLCDPIDSSPPGSPVSGILQARTLEWVAISFSNA